MKTAIAHDWLPVYSGAEQVLTQMMAVVGPSDLFTLYEFLSEADRRQLGAARIITSYLDRLPFKKRIYRHTFPFCPHRYGELRPVGLRSRLVVFGGFREGRDRSSASAACGLCPYPTALCLGPDVRVHGAVRLLQAPFGILLRSSLHRLRIWDVRTAHGPDVMVANSTVVRRRIEQIYGRESLVVHRPSTSAASRSAR